MPLSTTSKRPRLIESAIATLLIEAKAGRLNIDAQDSMNRKNSNYPSSLEYAKSLLYRTHEALELSVPTRPFKNSSEIYNYLFDFFRDIAQSQPRCTTLQDLVKSNDKKLARFRELSEQGFP